MLVSLQNTLRHSARDFKTWRASFYVEPARVPDNNMTATTSSELRYNNFPQFLFNKLYVRLSKTWFSQLRGQSSFELFDIKSLKKQVRVMYVLSNLVWPSQDDPKIEIALEGRKEPHPCGRLSSVNHAPASNPY